MRSRIMVAVTLAAGLAGSGMPQALAQDDPRTRPVFNTALGVGEVLEVAKEQGKALILVLENGARYTGKIKAIGTEAVVVTGLQGREFFDAYIPLSSIVAMEERVRLR